MRTRRILATVPTTTGARKALVKSKVHAPDTKVERAQEAIKVSAKAKKRLKWTFQKERAAILVAQSLLPTAGICKKLEITDDVLASWKRHPEFIEKVNDLRGEIQKELMSTGVSQKNVRIGVLKDIHESLLQVIDERKSRYIGRKTPGVSTGFMRRVVKAVGSGKGAKVVRQWEVDTDLISQITNLSRQIAQERGEWKEIQESTQSVVFREYVGINPDEV